MACCAESPDGQASEFAANDHDGFAEAYTAENETSLINAYYARPAILDLAGDVAGRRILDVGCGAGPVFASLRDRGATVTGLDASSGMLRLARERLGPDAALHHRDLADPLPFPDDAFDDVVASLVLHYLEDWTAPLAEARRVLKPGGRLIAVVLRLRLRRPEGRPDELTPAAARHDGCLHRIRLPDLRHQRTTPRTRCREGLPPPRSRPTQGSCASSSSSSKPPDR